MTQPRGRPGGVGRAANGGLYQGAWGLLPVLAFIIIAGVAALSHGAVASRAGGGEACAPPDAVAAYERSPRKAPV